MLARVLLFRLRSRTNRAQPLFRRTVAPPMLVGMVLTTSTSNDGRSLKMIRGIQTTKIANPQSVPCTIDFRALEAKRQPSLKQNTVGKPQ
jgi:hypothetical protein